MRYSMLKRLALTSSAIASLSAIGFAQVGYQSAYVTAQAHPGYLRVQTHARMAPAFLRTRAISQPLHFAPQKYNPQPHLQLRPAFAPTQVAYNAPQRPMLQLRPAPQVNAQFPSVAPVQYAQFQAPAVPPQHHQPRFHAQPESHHGGLLHVHTSHGPAPLPPQQPVLRRAPAPLPPPPSQGAPVSFAATRDNVETDILRPQTSLTGFKISVDGETVAGSGFEYESGQRLADKALSDADIQVKFDGLDVTPMLNVGIQNDAISVGKGEHIQFFTYSNYNPFIAHAEVRIFDGKDSVDARPLAIIPTDQNGYSGIAAHPYWPEEITYQLRVYDKDGKFDETRPKSLTITDARLLDPDNAYELGTSLASYGVDNTLSRNINVSGGAVTVYGKNVPKAYKPSVGGRFVPVDEDGNFVTQTILPYGDQSVHVALLDGHEQGINFRRDIHIKDTEFFYVAIGDLTLGQKAAVGPTDLTAADDEDFEDVVLNGRGAFYLKGKVKGKYLITAAMDTGEDRVSELFNNLDKKDPRQLLRRLDSDKFYPVYGDDSHLSEGAPTQGKFYVRVDKDDSHIMWGNFATQVTGTEFAHLDRGLYGGIADYNSEATTKSGERKTEATIFAADPGTIPGRDIFRGTGGSVYFLQRQDLSIGSERVRIEILDKDSGRVLETRNLRPHEDYDIDYLQGRILLSDPLGSTVYDGEIVRDGGLSGHEAQLVVRYEFTPGITDVGGYTVGGRATQWVGDSLRVGVTAQNETTDGADQVLLGVDALLRKSDKTYLKAEYARSEGPGFGQSNSTDGGFIFDDIATPGVAGQEAAAYQVEAAIHTQDMGPALRGVDGHVFASYEHVDEGFSGSSRLGNGELDRITVGLEGNITRKTKINLQADDVKSSRRGDTLAVYGDIDHQFNDNWSAAIGARYDERDDSNVLPGTLSPNRVDGNGMRTDASAEIRFDSQRDWSVKVFGQGTVSKDATRVGNSRGGIGGDIQINSRLSLTGEGSYGDGGLGANAQLNYQRSENSEIYLGYALSTDRSDTGQNTETLSRGHQGTITAGTRTRFNDSLSIYGEEQFGYGQRSKSLTHTYGVDYSPNEAWTFGATIENGTIEDEIDGDFERTAFSVSAGRSSEGLRVATNLEGRFEEGVALGQNRDRTTWLMRNTVAYDAGKNWELLGRFNFALSESDQSSLLNSDYVEGVLAAAYRPVDNDRLNGLFKYTYFEDLSPAQQLDRGGNNNLARQRTQILSADFGYDLNRSLTIGGKVGLRSGEVALDRGSDVFVKSDAMLGVIRADYHIVKKWDVLLEGRALTSSLADDTQFGALAGVYRHVGDNLKLGGGYSFSKYSDDLTDFSNEADGFFINMVGKF